MGKLHQILTDLELGKISSDNAEQQVLNLFPVEVSYEHREKSSWRYFKNEVFKQAVSIVNSSNCSEFKLIGYNFLNIRLIMYFSDCNEVYDFVKKGEELSVKHFYTKDKTFDERMTELSKFTSDMCEDKPEHE